MPSLILTGHPCIGKTTFANLLTTRALAHSSNTISHVVHIRESTACPDQTKAACYSNSHMEKTTRAALKSEFDRAVAESSSGGSGSGSSSSSTLVILDSLNYIKGYRYELYCISKAAGERHGVVWIMGSGADGEFLGSGGSSSSDELAKKRNRERKEAHLKCKDETQGVGGNEIELDGYFEDDDAMDALVLRYEPPDDKNRWENPLYKVDVTSVLPWGKDGTLEVTSGESDPSAKSNDGKAESSSGTLNSQMNAMEVKDTSQDQSSAPPMKTVKKSASGFKRRGKKTTQQKPPTQQQPQATASPVVAEPAAGTAINIPSSMASRNLKSGPANANNTPQKDNEQKQTMEQVIDSILDSFLTNIAPLQEGLSTLKQVSAESNVLNQVDNVTQRINNEILKAQKSLATLSAAGVGGKIFIPLNGGRRRAMNLAKPLYANELRNCRRQFLKWIGGHPMQDGTREEEIVEVYISYIESNI